MPVTENPERAHSRANEHSASLGFEWQSPAGDAGNRLMNLKLRFEEGGLGA